MSVERAVSNLGQHGAAFVQWYLRIQNDLFFFAECMGFKPTEQQAEIFKLVMELTKAGQPIFIACKSGQGPGKTAAEVIIAAWRTIRRVMAETVVTAPTMRQITSVWLKELRLWRERSHPFIRKLIDVQSTKVVFLGRKDWAIRTASATRPENMQGYHNEYLSFVVDEASGVAREIFETIEGTLKNKDRMLLAFGNPNTRDSAFFDFFHSQRKNWHCITLSAEDTPTVDQEAVQRMEEMFGRDSDVFRVRVLGEFPLSDPTSVMSSEEVEACQETSMYEMGKLSDEKRITIDFARFGSDDSIIYRRKGNAIVEKARFTKVEPDVVIAHAFEMQEAARWKDKDVNYVFDGTGMGQGLAWVFNRAGKRYYEFHNGNMRTLSKVYHDKISEGFFHLRKLVRAKQCHLPLDRDLVAELSNRQYALTLKGQICVESKDDYRKRAQDKSPDRADCAVMSFYPLGGRAKVRVKGKAA